MYKKRKKNLLSIFVIIILGVIAIVLGIAIYQQSNLTLPWTMNLSSNSVSTTSAKQEPKKQSAPGRRPLPANLTADEKILMNPPAPNDPQAKKSAHFAIAKKLATEANVLELNKCEKPSPLDLKLKQGQTFKVHNADTKSHKIVIDTNHVFSVNPKSTAEFTAEFGHGIGAYGYLCDNLGGVSGFFFVTE